METSEEVPTRDALEHNTGLHQQTAWGDFASHLLPIAQPDEESRVTGLSVDGQEVQIVVEAGESSANLILN